MVRISLFILLLPHILGAQLHKAEPYKIDSTLSYSGLLIVPFEVKMYMSGIDAQLAAKNGADFITICNRLRSGLANQIYIQSRGLRPLSLYHADTSENKVLLNNWYMAVGYQYCDVPKIVEDQEKESGIKQLKHKLLKKEEEEPAKEMESGLFEGQVVAGRSVGEKYMKAVIKEPDLLDKYGMRYGSDVFLTINQLNIGAVFKEEPTGYGGAYEREIKAHYTIFDAKGGVINSGVCAVRFDDAENDIDIIINDHMAALAAKLIENLPQRFIPLTKEQKVEIKKQDEKRDQKLNEKVILH